MIDVTRTPSAPLRAVKDAAQQGADAVAEAAEASLNTGFKALGAIDGTGAAGAAMQPPHSAHDATAMLLDTFTLMTRAQARLVRTAWDLGRECVDIMQETVARNVEGLSAISRARSLPDLLSAQFDLAQDNVRQVSGGAIRLIDRSVGNADETEAPGQRPAA